MTYAYDAASRTTGVRNAKLDGTVIAGYVYTRDAVGNPTGVSLSDGNLVSFSYDDAYRLTREQRSGAAAYDITYSYDATGNRTGKLTGGVTTTYTVDPADRLTLEDAGGTLTTYSYDPAGNNTLVNAAGAVTTQTWDLTNRMTGLADASGVTTLVYDATGLRRAKQDASGTTTFLWDGQTLLLEADGGGATQAQYTAAPGGYGPTVAQRRGTTSSFYHPTDLGTIENLTDASGSVTDSYAFTAFGVPVATSGATVNPHRYIGALGYYTDPTTGLTYVRARYLRPVTGSWLSVDPVASEPRYQYVGGRATRATDASGRGTFIDGFNDGFVGRDCAPLAQYARDLEAAGLDASFAWRDYQMCLHPEWYLEAIAIGPDGRPRPPRPTTGGGSYPPPPIGGGGHDRVTGPRAAHGVRTGWTVEAPRPPAPPVCWPPPASIGPCAGLLRDAPRPTDAADCGTVYEECIRSGESGFVGDTADVAVPSAADLLLVGLCVLVPAFGIAYEVFCGAVPDILKLGGLSGDDGLAGEIQGWTSCCSALEDYCISAV